VQRQLVLRRLLEQPEPEVQVHPRQLVGQERQLVQPVRLQHIHQDRSQLQLELHTLTHIHRKPELHDSYGKVLVRSCGMLVLHDSYGTVLVHSCGMLVLHNSYGKVLVHSCGMMVPEHRCGMMVLARSTGDRQEHKPRHGNASACDTCSYVRLPRCCSPAASPLRSSSIQFDSSYASF
jgi:hypothetical protein